MFQKLFFFRHPTFHKPTKPPYLLLFRGDSGHIAIPGPRRHSLFSTLDKIDTYPSFMWSRVKCVKLGSILLTNTQSRLSVIFMSGDNILYIFSVASDAPFPLAWSVDFLKSHTIGAGRVGTTSTWLQSSSIRSPTVGRSSRASRSPDSILSTSGKEEFLTRRYKVGLHKSIQTLILLLPR